MKGIILAGGNGTRLYPITKAISKQLLPIYNKPMIYYPINTLLKIGIKEILIITRPKDQVYFKNLLVENDDFNIHFEFAIQKEPKGIAESFIIGENFIEDDDVCLILGDNLFFNSSVISNVGLNKPSRIFVKNVDNPNRYGVLFKKNNKKARVYEKPKKYLSNKVVVGIYMYDKSVVSIAKKLKLSKRGELEITDINNIYLENNECEVLNLEEDSVWFDSGTFDSLIEASNYVKKNISLSYFK